MMNFRTVSWAGLQSPSQLIDQDLPRYRWAGLTNTMPVYGPMVTLQCIFPTGRMIVLKTGVGICADERYASHTASKEHFSAIGIHGTIAVCPFSTVVAAFEKRGRCGRSRVFDQIRLCASSRRTLCLSPPEPLSRRRCTVRCSNRPCHRLRRKVRVRVRVP